MWRDLLYMQGIFKSWENNGDKVLGKQGSQGFEGLGVSWCLRFQGY